MSIHTDFLAMSKILQNPFEFLRDYTTLAALAIVDSKKIQQKTCDMMFDFLAEIKFI